MNLKNLPGILWILWVASVTVFFLHDFLIPRFFVKCF